MLKGYEEGESVSAENKKIIEVTYNGEVREKMDLYYLTRDLQTPALSYTEQGN